MQSTSTDLGCICHTALCKLLGLEADGNSTVNVQRIHGGAIGRSKTVVANGFVWSVATANAGTQGVAAQTQACLDKLQHNLHEVGSSKHRIVEAVVYLDEMSSKAEMDSVWCEWIADDAWPCRACVGAKLAPGDLVEIKITALI